LLGTAGARDYVIYDSVTPRQVIGISATSGVVSLSGNTASTSTSTGALVVSGGLGVGGAIFAGGNIQCNAVFAANSTTLLLRPNGASVSSGQLSVDTSGNVNAEGIIGTSAAVMRVTNTSGAFQIYKDGTPSKAARFSFNTAATDTVSLGVYDGSSWTDTFRVNTTQALVTTSTASTSTSSGALVVSGGVGVAKEVYVGTTLKLANTSQSVTAWGDIGAQLSVAGAVITDTSSSGTVSRAVVNSIAASALAASSTTTYTQAASLFVAGAPTANTNVTITNAYAIYTAGGRINFQGLPTSSAGLQAGTLWNDGGTLKIV
jgi:hypothetical protein